MKKINLTIAIFSFVVSPVVAQNNQGAKLTAMANASAALFDNWSLTTNPAGITQTKTPTAAINYARYYFGDHLSEQNFAAVLPLNNSFAGLTVNRYGISEYNELNATLGLAKTFGNQLAIGISASYHQLYIANYGKTKTFSVSVGANYKLTQQVAVGLYVKNPSLSKYKTADVAANIPTVIAIGASYSPSNKVLLASTVAKQIDGGIDVSLGLDYQFQDFLSLRGGLSAKPFKQYVGLGFNYKKMVLDIAAQSDPNLGYTPQIGLAYAF